jgi:hypothetical protein
MLMVRHGGESHVVRPDRVYRTGVLTPIIGFQPQADVMANAAAFTLGPYAFQQGDAGTMVGSGMSGLGAAGPRVTLLGPSVQLLGKPPITFLGAFGDISNLGLIQRLWLRAKAWGARRKAMKVLTAAGVNGLGGLTPYGPNAWAAQQLMPGVSERLAMLVAMQQKDQPPIIGANNSAVIMNRWNNMR